MPLRSALVADLPALNEIAYSAKAHWGYDAEQLEAWRTDLEVDANSLSGKPVVVHKENGRPIGFVQVSADTEPWEIWALWVHPAHMGRGIGKALLAEAMRLAAEHGQHELAIDADPNAEGFYLAVGARVTGAVAAPIKGQPMRVRPQLRLNTSAA